MKFEERFKNYLKRRGLKFTPERQIILKGVFSIHYHFDVDKLYEILRKQGKTISRATIYRTLPLLVESGLVKEYFHCQGKTSYEHVFGHDHHDHLFCIKCGKIIEFKEKRIERLQDEICKKYEFKSLEHRLSIKGYCKKCAKEKLNHG
jgi:Fur family ferric uptake transcriptional regulator